MSGRWNGMWGNLDANRSGRSSISVLFGTSRAKVEKGAKVEMIMVEECIADRPCVTGNDVTVTLVTTRSRSVTDGLCDILILGE